MSEINIIRMNKRKEMLRLMRALAEIDIQTVSDETMDAIRHICNKAEELYGTTTEYQSLRAKLEEEYD